MENDPIFKAYFDIEKKHYNRFGYPKLNVDIQNRKFVNALQYKLKKFGGKMERTSAFDIKKKNNDSG